MGEAVHLIGAHFEMIKERRIEFPGPAALRGFQPCLGEETMHGGIEERCSGTRRKRPRASSRFP